MASLGDLNSEFPEFNKIRKTSFDLPPLPDFGDNADTMNQLDQNYLSNPCPEQSKPPESPDKNEEDLNEREEV